MRENHEQDTATIASQNRPQTGTAWIIRTPQADVPILRLHSDQDQIPHARLRVHPVRARDFARDVHLRRIAHPDTDQLVRLRKISVLQGLPHGFPLDRTSHRRHHLRRIARLGSQIHSLDDVALGAHDVNALERYQRQLQLLIRCHIQPRL